MTYLRGGNLGLRWVRVCTITSLLGKVNLGGVDLPWGALFRLEGEILIRSLSASVRLYVRHSPPGVAPEGFKTWLPSPPIQ